MVDSNATELLMTAFDIKIVSINELNADVVSTIYERLCWRDYKSGIGSMREELLNRYIAPDGVERGDMFIALICYNSLLVGWVGTRQWVEIMDGQPASVQTLECFTDPELRRRGLAQLGAQALVVAGVLKRDAPVAAYHPNAAQIAKNIGCNNVILVNTGFEHETS